MSEKRKSSMGRLSGMANWVVPKHSGLFDLEFDRYHSLRSAFALTMTDPLILIVSLIQFAAYGFFFMTILLLPTALCNENFGALLDFVLAAVGVQFLWAVKAVYIFDKAELTESGVIHAMYRVLRTTLFTLPFSFVPSWVLGCLAWPLLRIDLKSGFRFYDQSLLIGQYVQNSLWFVGAGQGEVSGNFQSFTDATISSRSRYWDAASEGMVMNVVGMVVLGSMFVVGYLAGLSGMGSVDVLGHRFATIDALVLFYLTSVGVLLTVTNTCAMAALSILEYSRNTHCAPVEHDLPEDANSKWVWYLPHAAVGCTVYSVMLVVVLGLAQNFCEPEINSAIRFS